MCAELRVPLVNFNPIWFVALVRAFLPVLVAAIGLPVTSVPAAREIIPPPMGEDIAVQVMRGGSAEIRLRAFEGRGNPLGYEIVRNPEHGRLEDFRQADKNRQGFASVVYVHDNDEESTQDEFAFRARALVGGGVSSPIKVKLRIIDATPKLGIDPVVNFSAVAGESDVREVILSNEGGGLLEGRLAPEEPFYTEGEGRFSLGRGESTALTVRFAPLSVGPVAPQKLTPARADPGATVTLKGEAKEPFAATAEAMEVRADGSRTGKIVATNFTASPLEVNIEIEPDGLADAPGSLRIAEGGAADIPLVITPDKKGGAADLRIRLSSPHHAQDVAVRAPVVPPRLEVETPELDFRQQSEAQLAVRNSGGVEGRFSLELPGGMKTLEGAANFSVAPNSERKVVLRRPDPPKVPESDVLMVNLGKSGKVPVPLLFAAPAPSPSPTAPPPSPQPPPAEPAKPWELNQDVKLETSGDAQASIVWAAGKSGWANASLEMIDADGSRPYVPAKEPEGWWASIVSWWTGRKAEAQQAWAEKEEYFANRLRLPGEGKEPAQAESKETWRSVEISPQDADKSGARWRVVAEKDNAGMREPVSEEFVIDLPGNTLVASGDRRQEKEAPEKEAVATAPPAEKKSAPAPRVQAQVLPAARMIHAAAITSERTHATVNLAIEQDETITGFRLERCELVTQIDPVTGIPLGPTYEAVPHDGEASILGVYPAEHEGKKLTFVVASIDGLAPGTATMWRLVPRAGEEDLLPTVEFVVPTKPPWTFPWRAFFLGLMAALLAAVLWLRHKQRKAR